MIKYLIALLALMLSGALHAEESIETIALDDGNTMSFVKNFRSDKPQCVLILLIGGAGALKIHKRDDGSFAYHNGNFLMRAREELISDGDMMTIAPDTPSDQADGYSDSFRETPRHLSDMRRLITYARQRYPAAKVFIVGTSRGTISSGILAVKLGDAVSGFIHTSTMSGYVRGAALPLWHLDYSLAKAPQLFVHHRDDHCKFTRFSDIKDKAEKFHIPFIDISGGPGDGDNNPCEAFSNHGFLGVEDIAVMKIKEWIRQVPP